MQNENAISTTTAKLVCVNWFLLRLPTPLQLAAPRLYFLWLLFQEKLWRQPMEFLWQECVHKTGIFAWLINHLRLKLNNTFFSAIGRKEKFSMSTRKLMHAAKDAQKKCLGIKYDLFVCLAYMCNYWPSRTLIHTYADFGCFYWSHLLLQPAYREKNVEDSDLFAAANGLGLLGHTYFRTHKER